MDLDRDSRLLAPSDYRTMPWKNGLGITHELAAERSAEDARAGGFTWRLSIAEVGTSAPFSAFPGCDRIIVLLEGNGMRLDRGADPPHLLDTRLAPFAFPGEWTIDGQLLDGPCRDFNVIVDRSRASARLDVLSLRTQPQRVTIDGAIAALFVCSGTVRVRSKNTSTEREVPAGHTLLLSGKADAATLRPLVLEAREGDSQALWVVIRRHS